VRALMRGSRPQDRWAAVKHYDTLSPHERFVLMIEAMVLLRALGLGHSDPAVEVRAAYPDAAVDEAEAVRWAAQWTRGWERRFAVRRGESPPIT
jgi:hypothetical protein